jgi:hypothetical protein
METPRSTRTPLVRTVTAALLSLLVLGALSGVAAAHDDAGEMTITKVEQTGPTTVAVEVGLVYTGDGHLAEDATVTALLTGPEGETVGPVDLTRQGDGTSLYAAEVQVTAPGTWTVAVTSTGPTAEKSGAVEVEAAPATEPDGSTTSSTLLTEAEDEQVFTTQGSAEDQGDDAADEAEDDGRLSPVLLVVAVAVLAVLLAGGGLLVVNRRGAGSAHDHTHDGPPPPDQMPQV